jgi:hypothetical protein
MPRPTADNVRRVIAEKYNRTDLSDEQVNTILGNPRLVEHLGLGDSWLDTVQDVTRPLTQAPAFITEPAGRLADRVTASERSRLTRQMTPARMRTAPRDIGVDLESPDFAPPEGEFDATDVPGMAIRGAAEFLNPFDIATTVATAGSGTVIGKLLRPAARLASGAMTARGAANVYEGFQEGDVATGVQGGIETLAGVLGWKGTRPPASVAGPAAAPVATASDDLTDLRALLDDPEKLKGLQSPEDVAKLVGASKNRATVEQMVAELKTATSTADLDTILAKYAPTPPPAATAASQGTTAADLRGQRLLTEQARTRAAEARAALTEAKAKPKPAPVGPAAGITVPPPANAAETAVDSAFPLSGRVSDPSGWAWFDRLHQQAGPSGTLTPGAGLANDAVPTSVRGAGGRFVRVERVERSGNKLRSIRVGDHTIDLSHVPGGKLTADELKNLLLGRGKLLTQARGRELPQAAIGEIDRMGIEYRRTMQELERLRALPDVDPMALQQMTQAQRELGFRLAKQVRDTIAAAATDERGQISLPMAIMMGRATASLTAGATAYAMTDDPEDKLTNAILAAGGTALATTAIPAVTKALLTASGRGQAIGKHVDDYLYFSMLSRPATILRANMGALSGGAHGVLEKLLTGDAKNARKILTALMNDAPGDWLNAIRNGSPNLRVATGGRTTGGLMQLPLRLIGAGDAAVVKALQQGGYALDDARRLTLAGPPMSELGQKFVGAIGSHWVGRLLSPFPRVQTLMFEHPASALGLTGTLTGGQRAARGAVAAGAAGAGYALGDDLDPRLRPFLVAAAGPSAIPMALGIALGWAQEQKADPADSGVDQISQLFGTAATTIGEENPFSIDPVSTIRDVTTGQRFVPGVVSDVARLMDDAPYGRDRREQGRTAGARSRIPGEMFGIGRETLPERKAPRDIFGGELPFQERPDSFLEKLFIGDPVASDLPSRYPKDSDTAQELRRLGVSMTPPRGTFTVEGEPLNLPPATEDQLIRVKGEMLERALTQIVESSDYAQLSDAGKADRLEQAREFIQNLFARDEIRVALLGRAHQAGGASGQETAR